MSRIFQCPKHIQEPRTHDAVYDNDITAVSISFSCSRNDAENDFILLVRLCQIERNCSFFDEMPEVISMQVHGWPIIFCNEVSGRGALETSR